MTSDYITAGLKGQSLCLDDVQVKKIWSSLEIYSNYMIKRLHLAGKRYKG